MCAHVFYISKKLYGNLVRTPIKLNKFVCLRYFRHTRELIFHLFGDNAITGEGLQIMTYARYLGALCSEG